MKKLRHLSLLVILIILGIGTSISQSVNKPYDNLDINNISARINSCGNLFWNLNNENAYPFFEVPKGSGKIANFTASLWIGGKDQNGKLHLAAERYRQKGVDYYVGPMMEAKYYNTEQKKWNNTWKVNKSEIDDFIANRTKPGYVIPASIINWPGNGNTSLGQIGKLAPYFDADNDGIYNPQKGDYPLIKGDQSMYWIVNDDSLHTETKCKKMGIEIHAMAYAYAHQSDSSLFNTIFINYQIVNLSKNNYDSVYIGLFDDLDIGYAFDDYIGSDVELNSYYTYNGKDVDGSGQSHAYGEHPPAISVTFLGKEMSHFMYMNNSAGIQGDPADSLQYYNYLQSIWKDGKHLTYGGNGHLSSGAYGPECNYMFPGDSDPTLKGTGGVPPNGAIDWTEATANNTPYDRRGLGSSGPMFMSSGSTQCFDIAFVWARDYSGDTPFSSVVLLKQRIAEVRKFYDKNLAGNCQDLLIDIKSINENEKDKINVYPNPSNENLYIDFNNSNNNSIYSIYSLQGNKIAEGILHNQRNIVSLNNLCKGMYILTIKSGINIYSRKLVKE